MVIVMGLDQHRAQITAEWIDTDTGELGRARVSLPTTAGWPMLVAQRWHVPGGGPGACGTSSAQARKMRAGS
jgi:hypothetical protein